MEYIDSLDQTELATLSDRYIRGVDKYYRMFAGISSYLKRYEKGILTIEIHNSEKAKPSNFETALHFALNWSQGNKELRAAKGFVVIIYKTISTGFAIKGDGSQNALLKNLIAELKEAKPTELVNIYSGLFTPEHIKRYNMRQAQALLIKQKLSNRFD